MLTAEVIGTGRTTGEVRPARCKIGWNCAAGAGQGSRDGDYPAMEATVAPCCLPVGLDFGYSAVSRGRMGLPYGKCRLMSPQTEFYRRHTADQETRRSRRNHP